MGVSQKDAEYKSDDPGIPEKKNKCKYQTHQCSSTYLYKKAVAICQIELYFHELNMQKTNNFRQRPPLCFCGVVHSCDKVII